jgi:hypothetical protein
MIGSQLLLLLHKRREDGADNLAFTPSVAFFSDLAIVSSVNQYFSENFSLTANAVYCNETPEIDETQNMVEVLIQTFEVPKFRKAGLKRVRVDVLVHVWYRAEDSLYGAMDLANEVADVFDHAVLEVRDYEVPSEAQVGILQMQEAVTEDLSDFQRDDLSVNYQHLLVKVRGVAQEI